MLLRLCHPPSAPSAPSALLCSFGSAILFHQHYVLHLRYAPLALLYSFGFAMLLQ